MHPVGWISPPKTPALGVVENPFADLHASTFDNDKIFIAFFFWWMAILKLNPLTHLRIALKIAAVALVAAYLARLSSSRSHNCCSGALSQ